MTPGELPINSDALGLCVLFVVGGIAAAINSVAGGGSLISFPTLIFYGVPIKEANATNSVGLWPGSLTGALGFLNLIAKAGHHLKTLSLPTLVGALAGAWLLVTTSKRTFEVVVPFLLLLATLLLAFQPHIKSWAKRHEHTVSLRVAIFLQFLVSVYGGYFGAGMGIMMLAVFTIYMEGSIHEINAVKTWLGLIINFVASAVFLGKGLILLWPAIALTLGSLIGGYVAARWSQKVEPDRLRVLIAGYGFITVAYFAYRSWFA